MTARTVNKILNFAYPILSLLIIAGAWAILHAQIGSEYLFPSLKATAERVLELMGGKTLWTALMGTLARATLSFLIALSFALVLAVASHLWTPVKKVLAPVIAIMRSAPTVAIMVILSFIATPKVSPMIVCVTVVTPMTYAATLGALKQIPSDLVEMSVVYDVPLKKRIFGLLVPSVLPTLIAEAGASLSFNVKLAISAEILAYTAKSLGGLISTANAYADMPTLFALTVISVLVATALELIVRLISYFATRRGAV